MTIEAQQVLSDELLDKTMHLFWQRGYFNTSIGDLVEVTGFNRAALYKHFGGKHGLFIAMLQRFRNKVVEESIRPLLEPERGFAAIEAFFDQFVHHEEHLASSHGCFLIATASNLPSHDPEVAAVIQEFIDYLRGLIAKILRYMQAESQLSTDVCTEVVADFLVGNVIGLMTMFRADVDQRMIANHVEGVTLFLHSLPVKKHPRTVNANLHLIS